VRDGPVIERAIRGAKARGLQVFLQVQAAIPPGFRVQFGGPQDDDRPLLPDGTAPALRVDNNGSLASPHIAAYGHERPAPYTTASAAGDNCDRTAGY